MSDAPLRGDGPSESSSADDFAERLRQRAITPLGVIDVRYAQRKYWRLVRWLDRRTLLLDRVRTLYGVEEAPVTGGLAFGVQGTLGAQTDLFSTSTNPLLQAGAQAARPDVQQLIVESRAQATSLEEILAENPAQPVPEREPPLEGKFRIRRRPPATIASTSGADLHVSHLRSTADIQTTSSERASSKGSDPDSNSPDDGDVSARQQPRDSSITAPPVTAEATITKQSPPDLVLSRNIVETSVATKGQDTQSMSATEDAPIASERSLRDGSQSSIWRQSDRDAGNVKPIAAAQVWPLLLIRPLAAESIGSEMREMVWRRPGVNASAGDFETPGSRASEPASLSLSSSGAFVSQQSERIATNAKTQVENNEVRVEHISPRVIRTIAERVLRTISLDLKLERERRGFTKWR